MVVHYAHIMWIYISWESQWRLQPDCPSALSTMAKDEDLKYSVRLVYDNGLRSSTRLVEVEKNDYGTTSLLCLVH